jgi:hypothetical protein
LTTTASTSLPAFLRTASASCSSTATFPAIRSASDEPSRPAARIRSWLSSASPPGTGSPTYAPRGGIPFVLRHALYTKAIQGAKAKNDKIDSKKELTILHEIRDINRFPRVQEFA